MSNSIGDLKNSGLQGNNFPWQLKMLEGLQKIYDEVKKPLTCAEDSINLCVPGGGLPVSIDCNDRISLCVNGAVVNAANSLPVTVVNPLPLEVDINQANDSILIYGFDGVDNQPISVDTNGYVNVNATVTIPTPLPVSQDPTSNPWTVDAIDLDIRNLTFATDSVDVSGSNVNAAITGPFGVQSECDNALSVALCQTQADILSDIQTAVQGTLDVNIVSSIELEVNLDPNNDAVTIYGSNPTVPVSTDGAGHLQVDVLTIPEVEIKNDAGNPIPVTGTVTITDGSGPLTVDGTVTANQGTNPWVVGQATHDNLNANANIQVNNTDVSAANPVPVVQQYPAVYASSEVVTQTGTTPVVFSAGATSMSVQNLGNDNITLDTDASAGVILPPGVSITWDAPTGQRLDTFTFTGTSVSSLFIVTAVIAS